MPRMPGGRVNAWLGMGTRLPGRGGGAAPRWRRSLVSYRPGQPH